MLERYTVLHEAGRSATGAVYAARDRTTGAVIALKRLDPALSQSDAGLAERFLEHARSARRLKHRNIVEIHDAGEAAGTAYIAMEMLEGESLRKILDQGPIPIARAIRIVHDIASGLAYAHLEGVVHGCLNPSNIIVLRSGAVKIADFDIGYAAQGDPVDHRSDLFALGALFYEMLTQGPPVEDPPPPSELNPNVPRAVDAMVLSLLADRIPGVPILIDELQRLEEGLGLASEEPRVSVPPDRFEPGRSEPALGTIDPRVLEHRRLMRERESRRRSSESRTAIFAALGVVLAVLGIGFGAFMFYPSAASVRDLVASRVQPVAAASKEPAPAPVAPQASAPQASPPPTPIAAEPVPVPKIGSPVEREVEEKVPEPQPAGTAQLILAISPGGELYVDGERHGATPPITTLDLEPGMHRIEVRSGSRRPYLTYMTVQAGDVRRVQYDFNAKGRPPG